MGVIAVVAAAAPTTGMSADVAAGSTSVIAIAEATTITTPTTATVGTRAAANVRSSTLGIADRQVSGGASGVAKNTSPSWKPISKICGPRPQQWKNASTH
jgi:cytoskeletal protein RodZ